MHSNIVFTDLVKWNNKRIPIRCHKDDVSGHRLGKENESNGEGSCKNSAFN